MRDMQVGRYDNRGSIPQFLEADVTVLMWVTIASASVERLRLPGADSPTTARAPYSKIFALRAIQSCAGGGGRMEQATVRAGEGGEEQESIEEKIKTACDNVQHRLQTKIDYNLDIFDRYVKKHVLAAKTAVGLVTSASGSEGVQAKPAAAGAAGSGGEREKTSSKSAGGGGGAESSWTFEVDERKAPKRSEEEAEVDADLRRLRKLQREVGRRCGCACRGESPNAIVIEVFLL